MKAYLFGSIFYEKDIEYNKILLKGIRQAWPGIDIFAPQEAPFNDKKTFASPKQIFEGDYNRLKEVDLLIGCLDSDLPPIGSTAEAGIFCELAKNNPNKKMIVLHTDTRDAYKTNSEEKFEDASNNQCHSQTSYFNLFLTGVIEQCGVIVGTKEQLFEYVRELYTEYLKTTKISGIYMITNRVNNKKYIGQSTNVVRRLNSHRWVKSENPQAINIAIQKYGIENFTFEILEECDESDLEVREKYWCNEVYECSTYSPYGYNIAPAGGAYKNGGIVVTCYNLQGEKIKTYPSIKAAAQELKCNPHAIEQALDNYTRSSQNMLWCTGIKETCVPANINSHHGAYKKVDVYDENLNFIHTYETITEAAKAHNCNLTGAYVSYSNPGLRCKYLYFVPHGTKPCKKLAKQIKKIYCYNKDTRAFIKEYKSAKEAAKALHGDQSHLAETCKGKKYYAYGYIWSYLKYEIIPADFKNINIEYWNNNK